VKRSTLTTKPHAVAPELAALRGLGPIVQIVHTLTTRVHGVIDKVIRFGRRRSGAAHRRR